MTVFEITDQKLSQMTSEEVDALREQLFDDEYHICRTKTGAVAYNVAIALIERHLGV